MSEAFFKQAVASEKKGQVDLAATLYERILEQFPTHPATLYNLATLNAKRNDYARAIDLYERFFQVEPDFTKAYYNAALCYMKKGDIDRATLLLTTAVTLVPEYADAQHLLGGIYLRQNDFDKAKIHLQAAINARHDDAHAHCHMGMLYFHLSCFDESQHHLTHSIALDSMLPEAHYHLGLIALKKGDFDEADMHFQSAVARDVTHFSALYNLALIKKKQRQFNLARHYIEKAYALSPRHPFIAYLYAVLKSETGLDTTPTDFVASLFDHYADDYDAHLTEVLKSDLPAKCRSIFNSILPQLSGKRWGVVTDLGCGTGLCGLAFRDIADQLIGTDLSEKMLEKAREKTIYDILYHENMLDTLKRFDHHVDLILCCDTLVYVGALEPFFEAVSNALRPNGYVLFTCEAYEGDMFTLSLDGRFAHSQAYLKKCAAVYGFEMVAFEETSLRDQQGEGVRGYVVILRSAIPYQYIHHK